MHSYKVYRPLFLSSDIYICVISVPTHLWHIIYTSIIYKPRWAGH